MTILNEWNEHLTFKKNSIFTFKKMFPIFKKINEQILINVFSEYFENYSGDAVVILHVLNNTQNKKGYLFDDSKFNKFITSDPLSAVVKKHGTVIEKKAIALFEAKKDIKWLSHFELYAPLMKENVDLSIIEETVEMGMNMMVVRLISRIQTLKILDIVSYNNQFINVKYYDSSIELSVKNVGLIHCLIDHGLVDWWAAHNFIMDEKKINKWIKDSTHHVLDCFHQQNAMLKQFHKLSTAEHHVIIRNNAIYLNTPNDDFKVLLLDDFNCEHFNKTRLTIKSQCNKNKKSLTLSIQNLFLNRPHTINPEMTLFI